MISVKKITQEIINAPLSSKSFRLTYADRALYKNHVLLSANQDYNSLSLQDSRNFLYPNEINKVNKTDQQLVNKVLTNSDHQSTNINSNPNDLRNANLQILLIIYISAVLGEVLSTRLQQL